MGEVESKSQAGTSAEEHLAYLGLVCGLIEGGRYSTPEGRPCVNKTVIEHYFKGSSARPELANHKEKYSWALEHKLLEEKIIEGASGKERRVVTFTERAKIFLYLAYIASQRRKISTYEMEFIRKSTLDFFVETSGLPAEVKNDLDKLYTFAVSEGFLNEPQDHVNGDGTQTCRPTPRLQSYLDGLALPNESQDTSQQAAQEKPGEVTKRLSTNTSRFRATSRAPNSAAYLTRVHAEAREDPIVKRLAERRKTQGPKTPNPENYASPNPSAEEVVDLGLQEVIDDDKRAKRMRAQLAERQAEQKRGLLGKLRGILND